jgi:hypothetical protein
MQFSANNLLTLNVYVNRKKKQPKVSPGLGENGVKLLLTWNFDLYQLLDYASHHRQGSFYQLPGSTNSIWLAKRLHTRMVDDKIKRIVSAQQNGGIQGGYIRLSK